MSVSWSVFLGASSLLSCANRLLLRIMPVQRAKSYQGKQKEGCVMGACFFLCVLFCFSFVLLCLHKEKHSFQCLRPLSEISGYILNSSCQIGFVSHNQKLCDRLYALLVRTWPTPILINVCFCSQVTTTHDEKKIPSFSGEIMLCKTENSEKSVTLHESLCSHVHHAHSQATIDS